MGCLISVDDDDSDDDITLVSRAAPRSDMAPTSNLSHATSGKDLFATRREAEQRRFSLLYKTGRMLGHGAQGKVFECWKRSDSAQRQRFAVKIVDETNMGDWDAQALLREVDTLKKIDHPNVAKIYDVFYEKHCFGVTREKAERGEFDSLCFIVMELLDGGELLSRLVERDVYTEGDARRVAELLLRAIEHCHTKGVVHRDIKPQNLMLKSCEDDWNIKVVDFGMASRVAVDRDSGRTTKSHTICGTEPYMAPEVFAEHADGYDEKVDVWSIGVTIYLLLSGEMPYAESAAELSRQGAEVTFDGDAWANVSDAAKCFVWHALLPDASERPSCARLLTHGWFSGASAGAIGGCTPLGHFAIQPGEEKNKLGVSLAALKRLAIAMHRQPAFDPPARSQPVAEGEGEVASALCTPAVERIVGTNFEDRVLRSAQHALVVFHTPFGVNCKTFLKKYERVSIVSPSGSGSVGERSSPDAEMSERLIVARMDVTMNDVARFVALDFHQLPTVMLFKAGAKDRPIVFEGDSYEVADMLTFVRQHCGEII